VQRQGQQLSINSSPPGNHRQSDSRYGAHHLETSCKTQHLNQLHCSGYFTKVQYFSQSHSSIHTPYSTLWWLKFVGSSKQSPVICVKYSIHGTASLLPLSPATAERWSCTVLRTRGSPPSARAPIPPSSVFCTSGLVAWPLNHALPIDVRREKPSRVQASY